MKSILFFPLLLSASLMAQEPGSSSSIFNMREAEKLKHKLCTNQIWYRTLWLHFLFQILNCFEMFAKKMEDYETSYTILNVR
jgi:hypothetical protein